MKTKSRQKAETETSVTTHYTARRPQSLINYCLRGLLESPPEPAHSSARACPAAKLPGKIMSTHFLSDKTDTNRAIEAEYGLERLPVWLRDSGFL